MFAVPALVADAGAVGAEAMGVTAVVALQLVAQSPRPPGVAHTPLAAAVTVHAFQSAHLCRGTQHVQHVVSAWDSQACTDTTIRHE